MKLLTCAILAFLSGLGCTESTTHGKRESIRIGASLPFTGKESALGRSLEQAVLLAIEDVNSAGGIDGAALELVARDSNSGSERGFRDLLDVLYNEGVAFLIGPEENDLANKIVQDIRTLDVLNVLPGNAAPSSNRSSSTGAWLRLAPSPYEIGCGLGAHARDSAVTSVNTLSSLEDYNTNLATDFRFHFRNMGGRVLSGVTVQSNQPSFASSVRRALASGAEQTLLIAYPAAAAQIVTEWTVTGLPGNWYLSPLLHTEAFLLNIPYGALDGSFGLSPTLSLTRECEMLEGYGSGQIRCTKKNSERFIRHFAGRWNGAKPFPSAHFYYDAVVLLAMGMRYAVATQGSIPPARQLHRLIRALNQSNNDAVDWNDLPSAMAKLAQGEAVRYVGAAAEYEFNEFGEAQHRTFDSWTIRRNAFVEVGTYYAYCFELD